MSERNAEEVPNRTRATVFRRWMSFSTIADICCHKDSKNLCSLHLRYVHITPNNREDQRKSRQVELLDLQHAFHINQASHHNTRGDQTYVDLTQIQLLQLFPNLRILRLNYCKIQNTSHLSWYLERKDCKLVELLLEKNQIGLEQFLGLTKTLPKNKTLRFLTLRGNPFEHNLRHADRMVYHSRLADSRLLIFPFDKGKQLEEWEGNYRQLTQIFPLTNFRCCWNRYGR